MTPLYANDLCGEYPNRWYTSTAEPLEPFPELNGKTRADICVIGVGFTGLSTALHLAQAGAEVALVEAHRVGFGASGRNGGQVGSGQRKDQIHLEHRYGSDIARRLWDMGEDAKALVRSLLRTHGIDAAWRDGVAHSDWTGNGARHSQAYASKLRLDYGYEAIKPLDRNEIRSLVGSESFQGGSID